MQQQARARCKGDDGGDSYVGKETMRSHESSASGWSLQHEV